MLTAVIATRRKRQKSLKSHITHHRVACQCAAECYRFICFCALALHSTRSRVYATVMRPSVRPSVRPSPPAVAGVGQAAVDIECRSIAARPARSSKCGESERRLVYLCGACVEESAASLGASEYPTINSSFFSICFTLSLDQL